MNATVKPLQGYNTSPNLLHYYYLLALIHFLKRKKPTTTNSFDLGGSSVILYTFIQGRKEVEGYFLMLNSIVILMDLLHKYWTCSQVLSLSLSHVGSSQIIEHLPSIALSHSCEPHIFHSHTHAHTAT